MLGGVRHHAMARPRVGWMNGLSAMEVSFEYIGLADADKRQGVVLKLWGMGIALTTLHRKK
jgi:hypothetical protein